MSKILTINPKIKRVLVRDVASLLFEQKLIQMKLTYTKGQVISVYSIGFTQYPFLIDSSKISEDQLNQLAENCWDDSLKIQNKGSLSDLAEKVRT